MSGSREKCITFLRDEGNQGSVTDLGRESCP